MSKASVLKELDKVYAEKLANAANVEVQAFQTSKEKADLEKAKLRTMTGQVWDSLKNETQRDQYLKVNLPGYYAAVEASQEAERKARFALSLIEIKIEYLKLVIKVNCEWQQEPKLK